MLAFLERQTGILNTRFLRDAAEAQKAIEALKSWIAREGGVVWSEHLDPVDAVIAAEGRLLRLEGLDVTDTAGEDRRRDLEAFLAWRAGELGRAEKIAVMQRLGQSIRSGGRELSR